MTPTENKKVAAVYCRVSTDDQANTGISIETQESKCTEAAKKDGYTVSEVIKDEGRSGKDLKRPGIQQVIKLVVAKSINAIYMVHSDRLARNTTDDLILRDMFRP
jgi:site-specific DNA recombinase